MDLYIDNATVFTNVCIVTLVSKAQFKFTLKPRKAIQIYIMNRVIQSERCLFNLEKSVVISSL